MLHSTNPCYMLHRPTHELRSSETHELRRPRSFLHRPIHAPQAPIHALCFTGRPTSSSNQSEDPSSSTFTFSSDGKTHKNDNNSSIYVKAPSSNSQTTSSSSMTMPMSFMTGLIVGKRFYNEVKVCSDINKPNDRMAVMTFISSLPIRKIGTCEDMLQKGGLLCALFSRSTAADLAEMLSVDMQKEGLSGRTLTLKLKTTTFEVNTPERKSYQNAVSELKADSSVPFAFRSLDEENKRANLPDDDTVSSSNQGELLLWVNDYKCSLCGIELPPCFVEERQEHFDFHLAERLQKEESCCDTRMLRHRLAPKDNIASQRKQKMQRASPKDKGHIPIDLFFVKSSQNF